jgi:excisionase family DNA binding protein
VSDERSPDADATVEVSGRLLTVREVAELLSMSERAVQRLTHSGAIPHVRIPGGRAFRYRRESVLKWVESLEQGGEVVKLRKHQPRLRSAG